MSVYLEKAESRKQKAESRKQNAECRNAESGKQMGRCEDRRMD